jgi:hypothetical protein
MKPFLLLLCLVGFISAASTLADSMVATEYVQKQKDKVILASEGQETELQTEVLFPFGIKIQTNGTFTVNNGKERTLAEGQKLGKDGMLSSLDGTLVPVMDHVAHKNGRVTVYRDGDGQVLNAPLSLEDGTRVMPDGMVTRSSGKTIRLMDGQMILLTGVAVPARDTITLRNGKVVVQKDGSPLTLVPTQTLMMNDGTKVFGNGTVQMLDGKSVTLVEGQIIVIQGIVSPGS